MSWVAPKTFWLRSDYINVADYNRWKNNVEYIKDLIVNDHQSTDYDVTEGYELHLTVNVYNLPEGYKQTVVFRFVGESGEETRFEFTYDEEGLYDNGSYICTEDGTVYIDGLMYVDTCSYFVYKDMGSDKAVNDFWYADEVNTIIDNLLAISYAVLGYERGGLPIYSDNGNTPTADECNAIEGLTLYLYNQIVGGTYTMYLGTGYTGSRIANILL